MTNTTPSKAAAKGPQSGAGTDDNAEHNTRETLDVNHPHNTDLTHGKREPATAPRNAAGTPMPAPQMGDLRTEQEKNPRDPVGGLVTSEPVEIMEIAPAEPYPTGNPADPEDVFTAAHGFRRADVGPAGSDARRRTPSGSGTPVEVPAGTAARTGGALAQDTTTGNKRAR